ncbi:MAG: nucleotidyltransferase family protein [Gammaproteobacteria bacterium]|nr:nucleotidyltransferase family protein [Gammaproteobacteria bacterium]
MDNSLLLVTSLARSYHTDTLLDELNALLEQKVDWQQVARLIRSHRVSALCLQTLRKIHHEAVPAELLQTLQDDCSESTRNALVLMSALQRLVQLIHSTGIAVICFKGVVAAQLIYGQLSMRNFSDIDLFVRQSDHQRTEHLLVENGFRITHRYDNAFQSGLRDEQRRVNVDLHWGIPPSELNLAFHLLWDDISSINIGNHAIPTFSLPDTIILTAVNAVKEYWDARLYRFCDLAELIQGHPHLDWNGLFRRAKQLGCQRMLYVALLIAEKLLGAPLPHDVATTLSKHQDLTPLIDEIMAQIEVAHLTSKDDGYHQTRVMKSDKHFFMQLQDSAWCRFHYWWRWVTTPNAADRQFIPLPRALNSLYCLIRPLRLLLQRTKGA